MLESGEHGRAWLTGSSLAAGKQGHGEAGTSNGTSDQT